MHCSQGRGKTRQEVQQIKYAVVEFICVLAVTDEVTEYPKRMKINGHASFHLDRSWHPAFPRLVDVVHILPNTRARSFARVGTRYCIKRQDVVDSELYQARLVSTETSKAESLIGISRVCRSTWSNPWVPVGKSRTDAFRYLTTLSWSVLIVIEGGIRKAGSGKIPLSLEAWVSAGVRTRMDKLLRVASLCWSYNGDGLVGSCHLLTDTTYGVANALTLEVSKNLLIAYEIHKNVLWVKNWAIHTAQM